MIKRYGNNFYDYYKMPKMNISPKNTLQFINLISVIQELSDKVRIEYNKDGIKISKELQIGKVMYSF